MLADNDYILLRLRQFWFRDVHTFGHFLTPGAPDIKQLTSGTTVVYYDTASDYSYIPSSVHNTRFDLASPLPAHAFACASAGQLPSSGRQQKKDGESFRRTSSQSLSVGS